MLSYFLKCRRNTESKKSKFKKILNGRIILSSRCTVCSSKKSRFIKEKDSSRFLTNLLGIKSPFEGNPI